MYALLPSIFSVDPQNSVFKVLTVSLVVLMSVMSYNVILWHGQYKLFLWAFVISAVVAYLVSFTSLAGLQLGDRIIGARLGRVTGTYTNANEFGIMLIQACFAIILLLLDAVKKKEKLILMGIFLILTVGVVSSGSRTAVLGLILLMLISSVAFNVWSLRNPGRMLGFVILAVLFVATIVVTTLSNPLVKARYDKFFNLLSSSEISQQSAGVSMSERTNLALMAWEAGVQTPFGIGLDNFRSIAGTYAHSNYFEIFASTGILGFFIYYSFYFALFIAAIKVPKRLVNRSVRKMLIYFPLIFMFLDMFSVSYYDKDIWLTISFVLAAIEINRKKAKEMNDSGVV